MKIRQRIIDEDFESLDEFSEDQVQQNLVLGLGVLALNLKKQ